ncbi:SHOCT domain-containing protein [Thermithiobacillus plumbiphilus]|uniref:SHOCT domain-containing protein n=1 Tax=Thermithiobacillus plumbiphilus TaxID=1729899 RepID=A0ABU9D706_9PROT
MMNGFGGMGGMGAMGGLIMLLFWVLIIGGIVWLIVALTRNRGGGQNISSALDVLKERYARGEINREEFEQKKRDLQ